MKEPLTLKGERYTFTTLCLASKEELESIMKLGVPPSIESLAGFEFKGYNTFNLTDILGIRKFKKGFFKPKHSLHPGIQLEGYNVKVVQNMLGEPWIPVLKKNKKIIHGYYVVYPVSLKEIDNYYPNALLLNYGLSKLNPIYDPSRLLRDYLVQVYENNPDLLVGKAYISLGKLRKFVSFFVLERENKIEIDNLP